MEFLQSKRAGAAAKSNSSKNAEAFALVPFKAVLKGNLGHWRLLSFLVPKVFRNNNKKYLSLLAEGGWKLLVHSLEQMKGPDSASALCERALVPRDLSATLLMAYTSLPFA